MTCLDWDTLADAPPSPGKKTALTIGVFDGVHLGHQALLDRIRSKAPELLPAAVTFRENPKKIISPHSYRGNIISFEEKCSLFEEFGVELCVIIDFSRNFSKMGGRDFVEALSRSLDPAYAAVGINFHCGYRRDTGTDGFKALAEARGIEVEILAPVLERGIPVSSSRVRDALGAGRFEEAERLLGRKLSRRGLYTA
ncbi:MAG: FAD synthetase family protein [Treponema sp.]|jgi:riboflavin kinase/FMN adenylyltransferase|nr:FAD synthetase family protein [Treponema sp.]